MEFFVQNKLVPVAIASLYKLVKDYESGNPVRGDDWGSNEGPVFQQLNSGIPSSILNGYYNYGAKVPTCDKSKKLIRGCAKLTREKGWKAKLKFPVGLMREREFSENPIVYDIAWYKKNERRIKELNFPKDIRRIRQYGAAFEDVCEFFQNKEDIVRAYFVGFIPPGFHL